MVATGRSADGCSFSPDSDELQLFLCQPLSAGYFPFSASLWGREGGGGEGEGVMGGGLLPSICCDGRLGSPEGASAWPDRNRH